MCRSAAIDLFIGVCPLEMSFSQDAILRVVNAQRSPDEQLTWAEYEMLLAEEKLRAEAARQIENVTKLKMAYKLMLTAKTVEITMVAKLLELLRRRLHTPVRQSQGDPDVTRMAESIPVPPTFMNCTEPEAS